MRLGATTASPLAEDAGVGEAGFLIGAAEEQLCGEEGEQGGGEQ
ncbi:hypothetical protein ACH4LT_27585 [Streptomyces clavifer]